MDKVQKPSNSEYYVGFEVLTAVAAKDTAVWNVTVRSILEVYQCFRGMYWILLQC
jgi:hypothetical protein